MLGIEFKTELEVAPKVFDVEFDGKYGEQKLEFETELKCDMKKEGDFHTKFEVIQNLKTIYIHLRILTNDFLQFNVNNKGIESIIDYAVTDKNKGAFESTLKVMNSPVYELKGTLSNKVEDDDVDVAVKAVLKARGEAKDKTY